MIITQLYNIDSMKKFDKVDASAFSDAAAGIVLAQNLTSINPKIFEKKYPQFAFTQTKITVDNSGGYANFIESLRLTPEGDFSTSTDYDSGKGKITLSGEISTIKVLPQGAFSEWSDDEIKGSAERKVNLIEKFINAHTFKYNQIVDSAGLIGIENNLGLLNNDLFNTISATGAINTLTGIQMFNDIKRLINTQNNSVSNTVEYMTDTVIMPTGVYNALQGTLIDTAGGTKSVLQVLQETYPKISFLFSPLCTNVDGSSRTVAFSSNENAMSMRIPVPLTFSPTYQTGGFTFRIDSKARIAGLDILEKFAGTILGGL